MTQRIAAGVDGGGTRTRVVLAGEDGTVLAYGESGPSNYDDVGREGAKRSIAESFERAFAATGEPARPIDAVFLGMAGVVSATDREHIASIARELGLAPPERTEVDHDIRISHAGGLAGEEGIALIVGTGSSCYGRRTDGRSWRAGGWGHLVDDAGGAYGLGLDALIATVRAADGRGAATVLQAEVLAALDIDDVIEIMHRMYVAGVTRSEIGTLARLVTAAAGKGDAVASEIIERGVSELALMVQTVTGRLEFTAPRVVVTGGLAASGPIYAEPLRAAIGSRVPGAEIVSPCLPPVLGAVLLAIEAARGTTPAPTGLIARLGGTWRELEPDGGSQSIE